MKRLLIPLIAAAALGCSQKAPEGPLPVIPAPQKTDLTGQLSRVDARKALRNGEVECKTDHALPPEGYLLEVERNHVRIVGGSEAGIFYGIQTLLQEAESGGLRCGTVTDWPRYAWRGFMLDEARHFSGKERVKGILDQMARLKLNRFHWHLTDAQGWRIQIGGWPLLTEVGAVGTHSDPEAPAAFYTQEDIREIVAYAAERHIVVVPEIDMPGHAAAANRAYPAFNGGGSPTQPDFTFNPGREETYAYLGSILREVAGLFPGPWLHIGGDEVNYGSEAWLSDPDVRALMRRERLRTLKEVEGYFLHRMADTVRAVGKIPAGWDDVMDTGMGPAGEVVDWWRHDRPDKLRRAMSEGFNTVLCPRKPLYFDFVQDDSHTVGRKWDGFCPREDVYAFPDAWYGTWELKEEDMTTVLGIQANLWSELTHTPERVDFMVFPRLMALAESAWTLPENKDYGSFSERMEAEYRRMDDLGINYFDDRDIQHHPEPAGPEIKQRKPQDWKD